MNEKPHSSPRPRPLRVRALAALCAGLGLFAVATAQADAKPRVAGKFAVSGVGTNNELTKGPDGNVWVTLDQTNDLARITPQGTVTEFNPANVSSPTGIATGPDGNLWTVSGDKAIRIPPADPTNAVSFPVLVAGRDIDAGRDGRLWAADFGGQVVRIATDGTAKAFETGAGSGLQAIATGPKGQVAYADPTSDPQKVGRIKKGKVRRKTAPGDPFGAAFGTDRAFWFPRFAAGDLLRLTTKGRASTLRGLGKNAGPRRIATGPRRTLWVTLDSAEQVAKVRGVRRR